MLNLKQYFFTVRMFLLCWEVIYPKVGAKKKKPFQTMKKFLLSERKQVQFSPFSLLHFL